MKKIRNIHRQRLLIASAIVIYSTALAAELPSGGIITKGVGTIDEASATMTINQATNNMVVTWESFNVGAGHTLNFVQPTAQAAVLNRVLGADVSVIQGNINANGRVFLVNPNGVLFTPTAQVNVGSLVASTLHLSTHNFMEGNYYFQGDSTNAVINNGNITAVGDGAGGGTVALIAAKVSNHGTLAAKLGNVLMAAGQQVTLDLGGTVKIQVDKGVLEALIEQGGAIKADGGLVYLTAKATGELVRTVINHSGITEAHTLLTGENGKIYLMGDRVNDRLVVGGILDASAPIDGDGGFIQTSAATIMSAEGRTVTTQAANGATGTYLLSRNDVVIGSKPDNVSATQLELDLASTNVTIRAALEGSGDIVVNDGVNWSANTLTLIADRDIDINARMQGSASSKLALQYGQGDLALGNNGQLTIHASVGLPKGESYSTKLGADGDTKIFTVIHQLGDLSDADTGIYTLQGMAAKTNLGKNFALGADIDASSTASGSGFKPIGSTKGAYTANFDGLGNEIINLRIAHQDNGTGLFGVTSSSAHIANVGLTNARINYVGAEQKSVGTLIGDNAGRITNSYATGSIWGNTFTGGLVGWNKGKINNSYFVGDVYSGNRLGGLVGVNQGSIANAYSSGSVTSLFNQDFVGGLVGVNSGTIANSYTSTAVYNASKIKTGRFSGSNSGTITNSYWDTSIPSTSDLQGIGTGTVAGASGLNATSMTRSKNFIDWDFGSTWYAQDENSAPLLRAFLKTLTITATDVVKTYDAQVFNDPSALRYTTQTPADLSQLLGTVNYGVVSDTAPDASSVAYALSASGLYTRQQGYIIEYAPGGSLLVNQAVVNLDGVRVYDGSTAFLSTDFGVNGIINGLDGQTLALMGAGMVSSKDVVTGSAGQQDLGIGTLALADGTGKALNYRLTGGIHKGTITPRPLTIKVNDTSKLQRFPDPVFTWDVVSGAVPSSDTLEFVTARVAGETDGDYSIWATPLDNPNFQFTLQPGTLTISSLPDQQETAAQSATILPSTQNLFAYFDTDISLNSEGLVFLPIDDSADSQSKGARIFMVGTGVNFDDVMQP